MLSVFFVITKLHSRHEFLSNQTDGSKLTKPMACCLQALDAAFNHDLEVIQDREQAQRVLTEPRRLI